MIWKSQTTSFMDGFGLIGAFNSCTYWNFSSCPNKYRSYGFTDLQYCSCHTSSQIHIYNRWEGAQYKILLSPIRNWETLHFNIPICGNAGGGGCFRMLCVTTGTYAEPSKWTNQFQMSVFEFKMWSSSVTWTWGGDICCDARILRPGAHKGFLLKLPNIFKFPDMHKHMPHVCHLGMSCMQDMLTENIKEQTYADLRKMSIGP